MTTKLFLLPEVAEMTGLTERALADAARAGKMSTYRIHGRRYMSTSQIEEYLRQHLDVPAPERSVVVEDRAWEELVAKRKKRKPRRSSKE